MGGKVLQLKSELDHAQGKAEGKYDMLYSLVADKLLSLNVGIQKSGKTKSEFLAGMKAAGYQIPQK